MATDLALPDVSGTHHYEAVLRISDALSACCRRQQLARVLGEELEGCLSFDYLEVAVFKEGTEEVEWVESGKGPLLFADIPLEELVDWQVYDGQDHLTSRNGIAIRDFRASSS